jgi:hypothetical protein
MRRAGRPDDQSFGLDERLFYRLDVFYPVGETPTGLSVRKPDFSVNREKHGGLPEYVLIPKWRNFGIAEFRVKRMPGPIRSDGNKLYSWAPVHVPEEENYHHSEVRSFKEGVRALKSSQVSELAYREFRQRISEAMLVIKAFEENQP